jgi:hypothetical protein
MCLNRIRTAALIAGISPGNKSTIKLVVNAAVAPHGITKAKSTDLHSKTN